jgi:hypothetical protein
MATIINNTWDIFEGVPPFPQFEFTTQKEGQHEADSQEMPNLRFATDVSTPTYRLALRCGYCGNQQPLDAEFSVDAEFMAIPTRHGCSTNIVGFRLINKSSVRDQELKDA